MSSNEGMKSESPHSNESSMSSSNRISSAHSATAAAAATDDYHQTSDSESMESITRESAASISAVAPSSPVLRSKHPSSPSPGPAAAATVVSTSPPTGRAQRVSSS